MVVEPMHSLNILSSVTLWLSNVVFLCAARSVLLSCLPLVISFGFLVCYFEISLPRRNLEEFLVCMVLSPDLVTRVGLYRASIATTLFGINPTVLLSTVLPHPTQDSTYVRTDSTLGIIIPITLQAVKVNRQMGNGRIA
jgi:hypothetical protein